MTERLVDVMDRNGSVLHTYPITLEDSSQAGDDSAYIAKALEAAGYGGLVSNSELGGLSGRIHVARGGQMAAYGDEVDGASETKISLEQSIRERAYLLWEQDGSPEGFAEKYWYDALDHHMRERAYALWERAGRPEGGAEEYWHQVREFEAW